MRTRCISATTGVIYQSSATSPYLIDLNERLSYDAYGIDKDQETFDLHAGVIDLRAHGIRYFMASHPQTQRAADASSDLRLVAETQPVGDRRWKVYEVPDVHVIEPLQHEPVVVRSVGRSRKTWERAARRWQHRQEDRDVVIVTDGPSDWRRSDEVPATLPRRPVAETTVNRVRIDDHSVTFDVSRTGIPVLVKVSYFPNWQATGADGPWRATPNYMVVVPHSSTVTLQYGRTGPEVGGSLVTLGGVAAATLLARRPPIEMPVATTESPLPEPPRRKPVGAKRKKRRK